MALACLAPVVALRFVDSKAGDGDNVTAAAWTPSPPTVAEAPLKRASTTAPTTTTTTRPDEASDVAASSPTTTTTTPVTEPPTSAATTTVPVPPPVVLAAPSATDVVVRLVNAERAAANASCEPLTVDDRLTAAAQGHSDDMAAHDYFSHTSLNGATAQDRAEAAGFTGLVGENIAAGQTTADDVMAAWMASEGHRANILNCDYTVIGVGLNEDGWYWTQVFGTPS
jgi:uncharacterized protein YkwD